MKKLIVLLLVAVIAGRSEAQSQAVNSSPVKDSTKAWFSIADSSMFTGKYKVEGQEFDNVTVVVKDSVLYFYAGSYEGELVPSGKDSFLALGQVLINFYRDAENKVAGFRADTGGSLIEGKREKPAELPKQK